MPDAKPFTEAEVARERGFKGQPQLMMPWQRAALEGMRKELEPQKRDFEALTAAFFPGQDVSYPHEELPRLSGAG